MITDTEYWNAIEAGVFVELDKKTGMQRATCPRTGLNAIAPTQKDAVEALLLLLERCEEAYLSMKQGRPICDTQRMRCAPEIEDDVPSSQVRRQ